MPKKTMTFEDAMLRLREVTETLEKGDVTLEESVKLFSEARSFPAFAMRN